MRLFLLSSAMMLAAPAFAEQGPAKSFLAQSCDSEQAMEAHAETMPVEAQKAICNVFSIDKMDSVGSRYCSGLKTSYKGAYNIARATLLEQHDFKTGTNRYSFKFKHVGINTALVEASNGELGVTALGKGKGHYKIDVVARGKPKTIHKIKKELRLSVLKIGGEYCVALR